MPPSSKPPGVPTSAPTEHPDCPGCAGHLAGLVDTICPSCEAGLRDALPLPADLHRLLVEHAESWLAHRDAVQAVIATDGRSLDARAREIEASRVAHNAERAVVRWTRAHLLPRTETP